MFRIEEVRRSLSCPSLYPVKVYEYSVRRSVSLPLLVDDVQDWEPHYHGAQRSFSSALFLSPALSLSSSLASSEDFMSACSSLALSLSSSLGSMSACSRLSACSSLDLSLSSSLGSEAFMSTRSELSPTPCLSSAVSLGSLASDKFVSDPPRPFTPVRDPAITREMSRAAYSTNSLFEMTLSTRCKMEACREDKAQQGEQEEVNEVEEKKEKKKKGGKMKRWRRAVRRAGHFFCCCWGRRVEEEEER
ncbi:uncharacterized protein LOC134437860 isoform X2 [Engraulis encrasicolus]